MTKTQAYRIILEDNSVSQGPSGQMYSDEQKQQLFGGNPDNATRMGGHSVNPKNGIVTVFNRNGTSTSYNINNVPQQVLRSTPGLGQSINSAQMTMANQKMINDRESGKRTSRWVPVNSNRRQSSRSSVAPTTTATPTAPASTTPSALSTATGAATGILKRGNIPLMVGGTLAAGATAAIAKKIMDKRKQKNNNQYLNRNMTDTITSQADNIVNNRDKQYRDQLEKMGVYIPPDEK